MTNAVKREILIPQPRERVWRAITEPATLAEWMYPNDFEPRVGHAFTFRVPGNPAAGFDGLVVRCEVLVCEPPGRLEFSWAVGGPVASLPLTYGHGLGRQAPTPGVVTPRVCSIMTGAAAPALGHFTWPCPRAWPTSWFTT